jgi:hypothetical protein
VNRGLLADEALLVIAQRPTAQDGAYLEQRTEAPGDRARWLLAPLSAQHRHD